MECCTVFVAVTGIVPVLSLHLPRMIATSPSRRLGFISSKPVPLAKSNEQAPLLDMLSVEIVWKCRRRPPIFIFSR